MSELKNCPFCGGEAKVLSVGSKDHTDWFKSECKGCEVSTNWYPAKSMLIKQWNTRKPEQVLLEALKDWNKSFKSVIDHKHHFDINVFNLFNERYTQAKKAIAEEGKI